MRFEKSKDGAMRATVRVDFRMDVSAMAEALAIDAIESNPATAEVLLSGVTQEDVARIVRARLAMQGPPEHWTEYGPDMPNWTRLRKLAGERVEELWPEVKSNAQG